VPVKIKKTKSEETRQYIIEKAAPIFNMYGYAGTSMSQLTKAIGMTKGAIYGNFKDKDEIALAAFKFNVSQIGEKRSKIINAEENANDKLIAYANFSLDNFAELFKTGGCPLLSAATDSDFGHSKLKESVAKVIKAGLDYVASIIYDGIEKKQINKNIEAEKYATIFLSLLEGGFMLSQATGDAVYLRRNVEHILNLVNTKLRT
jgi:AcrR family transcriptional regulator